MLGAVAVVETAMSHTRDGDFGPGFPQCTSFGKKLEVYPHCHQSSVFE